MSDPIPVIMTDDAIYRDILGNPVQSIPVTVAGMDDAFFTSAADRWAADRGLRPSIVANGGNLPIGSASVTGTQYGTEITLYCPDGARSLELFFAGFRVAGNAETSLTGASAMNVSYAVTPAPWRPDKAYAIGDQVTWNPTQASGGYAGKPIYKAVNANVNSLPSPGNPDWTVGDEPARQQCTVGGQYACGAKTITLTDGTTATEGYWKTDPLPLVGADDECFIAVRCWVKDGGGIAFNFGTGYASGSFFESGASITDRTNGGYPSGPSQLGATACFRPALVRGVPAKNSSKKTVAIIGDSICAGTDTGSSATGLSIVSGGSGYTSADIGKLVQINNAGGLAASCSIPVIVCITNVSAGAVSGVRLWHGGSYANTGLPSGTQETVNLAADVAAATGAPIFPTVGSGLTLTVTFGSSNGGFDYDPATYANGYLQRGLSNARRRWTACASPGDTLAGWATRSWSRLALLAQGNLDSAIVELGINDITSGRSLAQLKADAALLYRRLRGLNIRHIAQTTILPFPSSTDGFATLANQTAGGQDSIRQQFNAWVRSGADGLLDGYVDAAAAIEDGGASAPTGKAIANGTIGYVFIDGKHPTPRIIPTLAAVVQGYAEAHF